MYFLILVFLDNFNCILFQVIVF